MFRKVLVANRGEIAIRAFRAAYELGHRDRRGLPVRGPQLAAPREGRRVLPDRRARPPRPRLPVGRRGDRRGPPGGRRRGLPRLRLPVGEPRPRAGLRRRRHHVRRAARRGAAPDRQQGPRDRRGPGGGRRRCCASSEPSDATSTRSSRAADEHRVPDLRQGGGRRRRARHAPRRASRATCARPSTPPCARRESAFGDADGVPRAGGGQPAAHRGADPRRRRRADVVHLYERDCSVQRRHQKVIEIAPAPEPRPRASATASAPTPSRSPGTSATSTPARSSSCSTSAAQHVFIEMNPRIQVEHTVTEQVTDRDLVIAQLRIAAGVTLPELDLHQDQIHARRRRAAVPGHHRGPGQRVPPGHRRDQHLPLAGRPRRPARRRHDARRRRGQRRTSTPCWSSSPATATASTQAVRRARRAIAEFRIRGVATNLPFLAAVLDDPDFRAGRVTTSFIDERPQLLRAPPARPTAAPGILTYLAETTVNRPYGPRPAGRRAGRQAAGGEPARVPPRDGSRQQLLRALGPEGFAAPAARAGRRRRHRHDVPRRAPVAARHPGAHPRPGRRRAARRPAGAGAAVAGVLGRRDVRRRAAVPRRGPVGAARGAAGGRAQHLPADAAARAQHRRLHAVPDGGHRRVRRRGRGHRASTSSGSSTRSTTSSRCAPRSTPCARPARRSRRSRSATPATCPTRPSGSTRSTTTCGSPSEIVDGGRARARDQGHGRAAAPAGGAHAGHGPARAVRPAGAPAHPRHGGRPARHAHHRDRRRAWTPSTGRSRRWRAPPRQPSLSALVAATDHTERATGLSLAGGRRPRAVLGGGAEGLRAVRVRASRRRPAASTTTRSPAGSCPTCASRRSRWGSATGSS